jgi:hypothetical protein
METLLENKNKDKNKDNKNKDIVIYQLLLLANQKILKILLNLNIL